MFRQSRRRIVAVILIILLLLLFGTICGIYTASYVDMSRENEQILEQYMEQYSLTEETGVPGKADAGYPLSSQEQNEAAPSEITAFPADTVRSDPGFRREPPRLELSTIYSVAFSDAGEVLKTDTADISVLSEDDLIAMASGILNSGKQKGTEDSLSYRVADCDGYTLVMFLDNTMMMENAFTLIRYTLIFGGIAFLPLFFLARRIITPLEESYRRQKQFISDAGHELKTPVAVVNANLELLTRELGENPWLANIRYENERMSALITQLLELARTEHTIPPMEHLDFSRLVCGEALPFETIAYENGLQLDLEIQNDLTVCGNSTQLKQLTSILLDNAIRHSGGGQTVTLQLQRAKNHALLAVINDGEPIPPEQRALIFERFYRTDQARCDAGGHYGLGLAIAKAIVTAHGGSVEVDCYDGKVEFDARIPFHTVKR